MSTPEQNRKRNRSDNFDVADIELLLNLVNEHLDLVESPKLELRKQGWEVICSKFNKSCSGIKRDINALKLKIKNLKAQSKKTKLEMIDPDDPLCENSSLNGTETNNADDEIINDEEIDTKPLINGHIKTIKKRCKKFSKPECDLLVKLHEKYFANLDSSSTASSVKKRIDAWDNLTNEFNKKTDGPLRECNELKIKIKNIKAMRVKSEPSESNELIVENSQTMFNESDTSVSKSDDRNIIKPRSIISLRNQTQQDKSYQEIAHSTAANDIYFEDDDDFEDDYPINRPDHSKSSKHPSSSIEDKEIEKIRRENILLKNAVLRKKERLLELQISIAERNLRRQI